MKRFLGIFCAAIILSATTVSANEPIRIQASSMAAKSDGTLVAQGGVTIVGQGITAHADRMTYDPASSLLHLSGNVRVKDRNGGKSTGETMELDLGSMQGGIKEGEIILEPTGYRVLGDTIRRLGPDEYEVSGGTLTSCPGDCPDWSLTASSFRVKKEGYLTGKNVAFRLAGVPVFYSPYLVFPVKTDRQTGLLLPGMGFTDTRGWEASFPFYATLGRSADLTLTLETFSLDRNGMEGEFRYVLPYGGGGTWSGFAIGDGAASGDTGRYFVSGKHSLALLPGFWIRGRWYDAGNSDTPADFGRDFEQRNPGLVDRQVSLDFQRDGINLWTGISDLAPNAAAVRFGPTLRRTEAGAVLGPIAFVAGTAGFLLDATRFEDGGQRLLIAPRLSLEWGGDGGTGGRLSGNWIKSAGIEGSSSDSVAVVTLEERIAVSRSFSWGRHRLDILFSGGAADGHSFAAGVSRDGLDSGPESSLITGRIRSRVDAGAFNWEVHAGAFRDFQQDESVSFGRTSLRRGPWHIGGTWNRDPEFGLLLPPGPFRVTDSHGWTLETGYETERLMMKGMREKSEGSPGILSGSYRLSLGSLQLSGTAQYDLDSGDISDEVQTARYQAACWVLALTRSRNRTGATWKIDASVRY